MQGDWREFLDGAKTDLDSGLKALEGYAESRLLVEWAKAYGASLVEGFGALAEFMDAFQRQIKPLWCPICDAALHDGERCDKACQLGTVVRFLRGVGRE